MKNSIKYLFICLTLLYISCSVETIEEESIIEEEVTEEETTDETNPDTTIVASTEPCDYLLTTLVANEKKKIGCVMDLKGETVNLPSGVTLEYDGGSIINGKLVFTNTTIDYRLLNSKLITTGTGKLLDGIFKLIPKNWDIVEGNVSDEIAKKNKDVIQDMIMCAKNMGAMTFEIDKFDAYFKVDVDKDNVLPQKAAITLPSNFTLLMSENTHLRMQPNGFKRPTLLSIADGISNTKIFGGNLHGDRDEHDYSSGGTHEWGHIVRLSGCNNVVVEGVTFLDATGDGVDVHAFGHSFDPHYSPTVNATIRNNTFIRNRRNHISVTDGRDIFIENNKFIDASIHTDKSKGIAPGFAIDVEAVRRDGINYEIAEDIYIRNNTETGSRVGGFTVHTGDKVTIEGNTVENGISYSTSIGTIIRNNTLKAVKESEKEGGIGITAGRNDRYERNYGNRIYGNTVEGFAIGITMSNTDLEVYNNTFINNRAGMSLETITDSKIYGNSINSTRENSDGIISAAAIDYIRDVTVEDNEVDVPRTPFKFVNVNDENDQKNFSLVISNNTSHSKNTSTIINSYGLKFVENTIEEGGIRLADLENGLDISNNKITSTVANGIRIDGGCNELVIENNVISVKSNFECIKETTNDSSIESMTNNQCREQ